MGVIALDTIVRIYGLLHPVSSGDDYMLTSKLTFRHMDENEMNEHKNSSNGVDNCVFLVATMAKIKVFLTLLPCFDKSGKANSYMKMQATDDVARSWCVRNKAKIHKAANAYMVKSANFIVVCKE